MDAHYDRFQLIIASLLTLMGKHACCMRITKVQTCLVIRYSDQRLVILFEKSIVVNFAITRESPP